MPLQTQKENAQTIEKVIARLGHMAGERRSLAETFIRLYYGQVDPEDLVERTIGNLFGAALAHLDLINEFKGGGPKIRVYNPQIASCYRKAGVFIRGVRNQSPLPVK
jgi:glutamate dehydrogenase